MNQERLDLLAAIYTSARNFDNMDEPYLVSDPDGMICDQFNIQYMVGKEWIKLQEDKGRVYVIITSSGVDVVESYLNGLDALERCLLNTTIVSLLLDKVDRKIG